MTNNIFYTEDLDRFKFLDYNRDVQYNHVVKLKQSLKERGYFPTNPIIVDKNDYVLDGQHRLVACKELNIGVYFVVVENDDCFDDVLIRCNTTSQAWTLEDYAKYYAVKGNESYTLLRKFARENELTVGQATAFLAEGSAFVGNNGHFSRSFKKGQFFCTEEKCKLAHDNVTYIRKILAVSNLPFMKHCYTALLSMARDNRKFSFEKMLRKAETYRDLMYRCTTRKNYVDMFSNVYNYRERQKLFFGNIG